MIRFIRDLRPTNHVIFLYGSPEAKYNVLFNYLKVGLENGEAVAYIATEENPSQIRDAMKRFGIEVRKTRKQVPYVSWDLPTFTSSKENLTYRPPWV